MKRAQILSSDLSQLTRAYPEFRITDCEKLTAFADYRLPQVLEHLGSLVYTKDLTKTIQSGRIITSGNVLELEIRAATIVAVEEIKKLLPNRTSADVDLGLWLLSQDLRTDMPMYHRTPGYFY